MIASHVFGTCGYLFRCLRKKIAANIMCSFRNVITITMSCILYTVPYMSQEMLQHCGKFLVFNSQFFQLFYSSYCTYMSSLPGVIAALRRIPCVQFQFFPLFYNSHINVVITWSCCSIAANSLSLVLSSFHCCIAAT